jgi:hypothetical protein
MKYILLVLILISCKNNAPQIPLTKSELAILENLHFDTSVVVELKNITHQPITGVEISNQTGKEIPADLLPKMITCTVNKPFDLKPINDLKEKMPGKGYTIFTQDEQDGIQIIISKIQ